MADRDPPPHVLPYQGSKRLLAARIAAFVPRARRIRTIYEPFCGSAALSLYAASRDLSDRLVIGDSLAEIVALWRRVIDDPDAVADVYAALWSDQGAGGRGEFATARARFNALRDPVDLLWLAARCVKGAIRFGRDGRFNQSADHRRRGSAPDRVRTQLRRAAALLRDKAAFVAGDWRATLAPAGTADLAYLDPPYHGTSTGADRRYHQGLDRGALVAGLRDLRDRGVPVLLSYDGHTGGRSYGEALPADLGLVRFELDAGRSAQATLHGRADRTVESLYVSASLCAEVGADGPPCRPPVSRRVERSRR